jgi:hypothetical protein
MGMKKPRATATTNITQKKVSLARAMRTPRTTRTRNTTTSPANTPKAKRTLSS